MWKCGNRITTPTRRPDDGGEKDALELHEKWENLALAHLDKMMRSIPQIEIISQGSSLSRCNPSSSSLEDSSKLVFIPHRYQSWSPSRCARLATAFDERLVIFQGRPELD